MKFIVIDLHNPKDEKEPGCGCCKENAPDFTKSRTCSSTVHENGNNGALSLGDLIGLRLETEEPETKPQPEEPDLIEVRNIRVCEIYTNAKKPQTGTLYCPTEGPATDVSGEQEPDTNEDMTDSLMLKEWRSLGSRLKPTCSHVTGKWWSR